MVIVLRNIAFYGAFYLGSVVYVLAALVAAAVARGKLMGVVVAWSTYHRTCLRLFAGIDVVEDGHRPTGPYFYAIRHESFFEAIDTPAHIAGAVPFAKYELSQIPGWGRAAQAYGMVFVARDEGAKALRTMFKEARDHAKGGRPLVIFPEGTRVPHGERRPLQAGFAGLYKMLGLPVVPVAVDSGPLYHRAWKRPGKITYRYGEIIPAGLPREEVEARVIDAINALNV